MVVQAHSPRVYRRRRQRMRRLLFFLLTVAALFYFIHSGFFSLENIEITGNEHIPTAELENLIGVARGINLWQVDTAAIAKRLATHPLVAKARVSRRWPRTLAIQIEERTPVAILVQDGSFLLVDGGGVVMERIPRIGHLKLPLISGLGKLENTGPGREINHAGLQAALAVVRQVPPGDLNQLQEIIASSPVNLQLIWAGNILVKFGDGQQVAEKLNRLHEALQGLAGREAIDYIDVSFAGPPVVKFNQPEKQGKKG
ncbi:Cell division protein FtsQ/DivIB [Moorella glycerini]|uniref:Cell division protein DivIB n=1 Tax=Neomoorella stamsii TaxID=1266720 RepID=A0A9X7P604_9FIRM|nr:MULTISPECIES: FtsQ-type POTRA domain-containing protein [Moorella]PRR72207.1 Cell division protein DivIB [Moorella stamsii]CEP69508.1 Cell division protein FtsQ/DivIB [Moorella glycerini]